MEIILFIPIAAKWLAVRTDEDILENYAVVSSQFHVIHLFHMPCRTILLVLNFELCCVEQQEWELSSGLSVALKLVIK